MGRSKVCYAFLSWQSWDFCTAKTTWPLGEAQSQAKAQPQALGNGWTEGLLWQPVARHRPQRGRRQQQMKNDWRCWKCLSCLLDISTCHSALETHCDLASHSGCCCFLFIIAGRISWGCNVASPCDYCCASRRNCLTPPEYIYISCPAPPPAVVEVGMREKGGLASGCHLSFVIF